MKIATLILRNLLGLALIVFGLNKFIGFMPAPPLEGEALDFIMALGKSGYIFPAVGVIELVVGVMLVTNLFAPLALLLLAPISVNIVLFHLALDPAGIAMAGIIAALNIVLLFAYKPAYAKVLKPRPCDGNCCCKDK